MNSRKGAVVFLSWLSVVGWMGFIFLLSMQAGEDSAELSGGFVGFFSPLLQVFLPNASTDALHTIIRKMAHFTEFAILAVLLVNALRQHFNEKKEIYGLSLIIGILYAMSDEIHQLFIESRDGNVVDVFIDTLGIMAGLLLFEAFVQIFKRNRAEV
jgi:VanZ family protein